MFAGLSPMSKTSQEEASDEGFFSDVDDWSSVSDTSITAEDATSFDLNSFKQAVNARVKFLRWSGADGSTPPFCPYGPTLFRKEHYDDTSPLPRKPSPLSTSKPLSNVPPDPPVSMPQTGFQALVLCGPGVSLNTFSSVPAEYPKVLIPIANRPMVWYVLDWCYRMGITSITLIAPPQSQAALSAALQQNPHLTSLPSPSPTILAPPDLAFTTGTAELLRLQAVQDAIKSDFILLPCDLVCDVGGDAFLTTWMTHLGGLGGLTDGQDFEVPGPKMIGLGGEKGGRRGGLSVWYNTTGREESIKGEECDFNATAKFDAEEGVPPSVHFTTSNSSEAHGVLRKLVWATPMDSLRDECEENEALWQIRSSLLKRYGAVKCLTRHRDSHIYFFPYWIKDFAKENEDFESVSEDLVGTWAKAEWRKPSYRARFGIKKILGKTRKGGQVDRVSYEDLSIEEEIDILSLSSTRTSRSPPSEPLKPRLTPISLASRVNTDLDDSQNIITPDPESDDEPPPPVPPMVAYIHPSSADAPLVRRVDTAPLLLSVSLLLAKLPSQEESSVSGLQPSPLSHPHKVAPTAMVAPRTTITKPDCLIGDNVSVAEKCVIKESVLGAGCTIGEGARLTKCLIMDGATVQEKCVLHGAIVGKKALIGKQSSLQNCEVQDGNAVAERTEAKNENFMIGGFTDEEAGSDFEGTGDDSDGGEDDVFG
ncbi:MAG: hypothetical protein Q9160_007980 [Pyrenula sp. 1 TL-2023]